MQDWGFSSASHIWGPKIKCFKRFYVWIRNKNKAAVPARLSAIFIF